MHKNSILKICHWLAVLLPISIASGKGVADVNLSLLAGLFVIHTLISRDFKPFRETWVIVAFSLVGYLLLRNIFVESPLKGILKVLGFCRFILAAICMQALISQDNRIHKHLLLTTFISVSFLALDGYLQYFTGVDIFGKAKAFEGSFYRLTGPFSKKILGATIAVLSMPLIAVSMYYASLKRANIIISTLFIFGLFFIVFFSGERSALIQITLGTLFVFTVMHFRAQNMLWMTGIAALVTISIFAFGPTDVIQRQIHSIVQITTHFSESAYGKLWISGLKTSFAHPIFGVGINNFEQHCQALTDMCSYHPHNMFIEFWSESGIIGLIFLITLMFVILKKAFDFYMTKNGMLKYLILGTATGAMLRFIPFLPSSGFFKSWYAVPIWFMIGWTLCITSTKIENK